MPDCIVNWVNERPKDREVLVDFSQPEMVDFKMRVGVTRIDLSMHITEVKGIGIHVAIMTLFRMALGEMRTVDFDAFKFK